VSEIRYGGQAVIEGVMMRGARNMAVAVRKPSGEILVHSEPLPAGLYNSPVGRLPFVRGLTMLWDTMVLGTRTLMFSADAALAEEEVQFSGPMMWGTMGVSLLFGMGLFVAVPTFLIGLVDRLIASPLLSNLAEGLVRVAIFVAYLLLIRRMPDIRRVFAYHGAEHKTVNAYEAGVTLTPTEVEAFSTRHTRCGTSFLLVTLILFVVISSFLGRPALLTRLVIRLAMIPLVASIAYEFIRFAARHDDHPLIRLLTGPGMALQRLTTEQPDSSMLEVAIAALQRVIAADAAGT